MRSFSNFVLFSGSCVATCFLWMPMAMAYKEPCLYSIDQENAARQRHGKRRCFADEAKKNEIGYEHYKNAKPHGKTQYVDEKTHKLQYEAEYIDGMQHGVEKIYDRRGLGQLETENHYKNGQLHGIKKEFYTRKDAGKLRSTTVFADGKEIGPITEYRVSGTKEAVVNKVPNYKDYRTYENYYETGDLQKISFYYQDANNESLRLDFTISGEIKNVVCTPPKQSYVYDAKECQKHFKFKFEDVRKNFK